ncbi:hypothetical protein ADUPG1_013938 [Aduncisulcus paluster]|uniref:Uncharacterized protein n=1 Tax=Aduncisulcus paluster TaxID=2918883 RepID=A0ABQ5K508_9EUKA|nr:hypothetical protein ADUPG1_013938 [Aduncisulcus paluster]
MSDKIFASLSKLVTELKYRRRDLKELQKELKDEAAEAFRIEQIKEEARKKETIEKQKIRQIEASNVIKDFEKYIKSALEKEELEEAVRLTENVMDSSDMSEIAIKTQEQEEKKRKELQKDEIMSVISEYDPSSSIPSVPSSSMVYHVEKDVIDSITNFEKYIKSALEKEELEEAVRLTENVMDSSDMSEIAIKTQEQEEKKRKELQKDEIMSVISEYDPSSSIPSVPSSSMVYHVEKDVIDSITSIIIEREKSKDINLLHAARYCTRIRNYQQAACFILLNKYSLLSQQLSPTTDGIMSYLRTVGAVLGTIWKESAQVSLSSSLPSLYSYLISRANALPYPIISPLLPLLPLLLSSSSSSSSSSFSLPSSSIVDEPLLKSMDMAIASSGLCISILKRFMKLENDTKCTASFTLLNAIKARRKMSRRSELQTSDEIVEDSDPSPEIIIDLSRRVSFMSSPLSSLLSALSFVNGEWYSFVKINRTTENLSISSSSLAISYFACCASISLKHNHSLLSSPPYSFSFIEDLYTALNHVKGRGIELSVSGIPSSSSSSPSSSPPKTEKEEKEEKEDVGDHVSLSPVKSESLETSPSSMLHSIQAPPTASNNQHVNIALWGGISNTLTISVLPFLSSSLSYLHNLCHSVQTLKSHDATLSLSSSPFTSPSSSSLSLAHICCIEICQSLHSLFLKSLEESGMHLAIELLCTFTDELNELVKGMQNVFAKICSLCGSICCKHFFDVGNITNSVISPFVSLVHNPLKDHLSPELLKVCVSAFIKGVGDQIMGILTTRKDKLRDLHIAREREGIYADKRVAQEREKLKKQFQVTKKEAQSLDFSIRSFVTALSKMGINGRKEMKEVMFVCGVLGCDNQEEAVHVWSGEMGEEWVIDWMKLQRPIH